MKKKISIALFLGIGFAFVACHKDSSVVRTADPVKQNEPSGNGAGKFTYSGDTISSFIPTSTANTMISSYIASIGGNQNDSDLRSFTVNADSLRAYLANTSVKNIKLVFAHTKYYIDQGHYGVHAGYQSGAMTIIIAGYDATGNYIFYNDNVLDHCVPCPYTCPPGNAGNELF